MKDLSRFSIKGQPIETVFPERLLSGLQLKHYEKTDPVLLAGEAISYLGIVLDGRCVVKQLGEDGQETILGYLHHGDLVGEIEMFTDRTCLHYVYADSSTILLLIPKTYVKKELLDYSPFLRFVLDGAFEKLLARTTYFSDTRLYGHKAQTIAYIKDMEKRLGQPNIPFVVTEVAPFIGVSERHLRRILKELQQEGLITKRYKRIDIHGL